MTRTRDRDLDGEDVDYLMSAFDDIADTSLHALDDATSENIETRDVVRMINYLDHEVERMMELVYDRENDVEHLIHGIMTDLPEISRGDIAEFFGHLSGYTEEEILWAMEDAGIPREERFMIRDEVRREYGFDEFDPETFEEEADL